MIVWSYSLYGTNKEVYYKPMLENIKIAKRAGAKIIISTTDVYENDVKTFFALYLDDIKIIVYSSNNFSDCEVFLRFLSVDTIEADFYFLKDSDSIVTERELAIMNDWINLSVIPYIIIRDNPIHVSPILAGMFGFRRSERDEFVLNCHNYLAHSRKTASYGKDQQWLADKIYPLIRDKALVYSSFFYLRGEKLVRIKKYNEPGSFIGAQAEGNINPYSLQHYFEHFYGEDLLSLPYFRGIPLWLSHLIYGRVRPSVYLAIIYKWIKR